MSVGCKKRLPAGLRPCMGMRRGATGWRRSEACRLTAGEDESRAVYASGKWAGSRLLCRSARVGCDWQCRSGRGGPGARHGRLGAEVTWGKCLRRVGAYGGRDHQACCVGEPHVEERSNLHAHVTHAT